MEVVNIYGDIPTESKILISLGNHNGTQQLLCYRDILVMEEFSHATEIVEATIIYEKEGSFSLRVDDRYIGVDSFGYSIISKEKVMYNIDYSSVDNSYREKILSGVLYSLSTMIDGKREIVKWRTRLGETSELVIFLPTVWYEDVSCERHTGKDVLFSRLNQLRFKGYTSMDWCKTKYNVLNCESTNCGSCFGPCPEEKGLCTRGKESFYCSSESQWNNIVVGLCISMFCIVVIVMIRILS